MAEKQVKVGLVGFGTVGCGVAKLILEEAERLEAEVIIMGSHGHGALYDLIVGSVTEGVLRKAKCPVLVLPSKRD